MAYLIVAEWDKDGKPRRTNSRSTEAEATELYQKVKERYPQAICVEDPGVDMGYLTVNSTDDGIVVDTERMQTDIEAKKWAAIRAERQIRFEAVDDAARDVVWGELDATKKVEWKAYRKALRDLPQTYSNPDDVVWPTPPQ